jgi:hypothetical protein
MVFNKKLLSSSKLYSLITILAPLKKFSIINTNSVTYPILISKIATVIKKNQNLKNIFQKIKNDFKTLCLDFFEKKNFKYVYINYERYNYNLVEYMCSYKKGEKFSILDFCAAIGIFIPHFCYHPDLSIAGNCRMCLVQLDGSIKPVASCAITMSNKMVINTQSIFVKKLQEGF